MTKSQKNDLTGGDEELKYAINERREEREMENA
jgi:hypothetical protein